jgi:hypothetical protein
MNLPAFRVKLQRLFIRADGFISISLSKKTNSDISVDFGHVRRQFLRLPEQSLTFFENWVFN